MRQLICDRFEFLGLYLDEEKNRIVDLQGYAAPQIQLQESRVKVIVTQTCEQLMIAQEVRSLLDQSLEWKRSDRGEVATTQSSSIPWPH
jgi:acetate kinase